MSGSEIEIIKKRISSLRDSLAIYTSKLDRYVDKLHSWNFGPEGIADERKRTLEKLEVLKKKKERIMRDVDRKIKKYESS